MSVSAYLVLFAVVLGVLVLAFAGIGIGILLGRRKTIQGCACEFNADKARAAYRAGSCSGCSGSGAKL